MTGVSPGARLRFGVLIGSRSLREWQLRCIRELVESDSAQLSLVVVDRDAKARGSALFSLCEMISTRTGPARRVRLPEELGGAGLAGTIGDHDLDFVLCIGTEASGPVLGAARHGSWAFRVGAGAGPDRDPTCVWEVYRGLPVTVGRLRRLEDGADLRAGRYGTVLHSWKASRDGVLSDIAAWPREVCEQIRTTGGVAAPSPVPEPPAGPARLTNWQTVRLLCSTAWRTLGRAVSHVLWREHWNVGIVRAPVDRLLDEASQMRPIDWLPSRRDSYMADPFAIEVDDRLHVFYELWHYRRRKGVIAHRELTAVGVGEGETVLELPGHLSYPFVLRHDGAVYLVPEASSTGEVALYGTDSFPRGWRKVATLLEIPALDPTVFHHDGRWWLFATLGSEGEDLKLFAWHASDLLGPWEPHARNPIKADIAAARPAGPPFVHDGRLYRPAQDSSETYGGRVVLNRVTSLSPTSFSEETVAVASPDASGPFPEGLHTICGAGGITVIDGKRRLLRPPGVLMKAAPRAIRLRRSTRVRSHRE